MGQTEVYNYLKNRPYQWKNIRQICKGINEHPTSGTKFLKVAKLNDIQMREERSKNNKLEYQLRWAKGPNKGN